MKERGQISSEVLTYALTIIIVGVIIAMGYRYISSSKNVMDNAELLQFKNKLAFDIKSVGSEYGASRRISYLSPQNVDEVCFVDLSKKDRILSSKIIGFYPIIKDILNSNISKNLFYIGAAGWSSSYVEDVVLDHYPFMNCFHPKNNKIDLVLEGLGGNTAKIAADFVTKAKINKDRNTILHSADEIITLEIPSGTVASADEITIEMAEPIIRDSKGASDLYLFGPAGITFSNPIELMVKYNPATVGDCPNMLFFYIYSEDGQQKNAVPSKRIDCKGKVVIFDINGFS